MIISQCFVKCKKVERERERWEQPKLLTDNWNNTYIQETGKKKKKEEGKENYITNQGPIFFFIPYSAEYEWKQALFDATQKRLF